MVINPIKFWLSLIQWPLAMSFDGPEVPKPDPQIGKASLESIELAREQDKRAAGMQEWIKSVAGPVINQQVAAGDETMRQAITQYDTYQSMFPALETRMVLDTFGYDDLNDVDAEKLLASFGDREKQILQDRYTQDLNDISSARARATQQNATGTAGASSLTPEYFTEQERLAQEKLTKNQGLLDSKLGIVRDTRTAGLAAQEAEAARAKADVTMAGEAQQGIIDRQLSGMGVNPNSPRFNATKRNAALRVGADVAGAGTNARRVIKGQQKAGIINAVNVGRGYPGLATNISGTGTGQGNSAVGNVNQSGGGVLAAGNASVPLRSAGISGLVNKYNADVSAYQANDMSGLWGTLGAAAGGLAANPAIFASSKKLKTRKKPVNNRAILAKLMGLPVEEWEYKPGVSGNSEAGVDHIGPYAEDMKETFGVGDGKTIHPADQGGIILSALKALNEKVDKLEARRAA